MRSVNTLLGYEVGLDNRLRIFHLSWQSTIPLLVFSHFPLILTLSEGRKKPKHNQREHLYVITPYIYTTSWKTPSLKLQECLPAALSVTRTRGWTITALHAPNVAHTCPSAILLQTTFLEFPDNILTDCSTSQGTWISQTHPSLIQLHETWILINCHCNGY